MFPSPLPSDSFLIKRLEVSPESNDHDDGQPVRRDANRVRISVTLTPGLGPDIRAGDIAHCATRVDERDDYSPFRRRARKRGTNPRPKSNQCGIRLSHQESRGVAGLSRE